MPSGPGGAEGTFHAGEGRVPNPGMRFQQAALRAPGEEAEISTARFRAIDPGVKLAARPHRGDVPACRASSGPRSGPPEHPPPIPPEAIVNPPEVVVNSPEAVVSPPEAVVSSPEVVVIGNAGIDTQVYLHGADIDFTVEANFTENLDVLGQAGAYASRGYAALGRRTSFVGAVGEDPAGQVVREELARAGVDTRGLFLDPKGTARSVNLMYRDGRRKNFYDGKGHMDLHPDLDACRASLAGARLAHFNIPSWARQLLPVARSLGLTIACDIQDVVDPGDPYRRDFIESADILFCSGVNHPDPAPLVEALLRARPEAIVVVGMGAQGCALATRAGLRRYPPAPLDLPVLDTNGAGDALAVGFLVSHVLEGRSMEEAALRGQIAARVACAQRAPKRMITAEELERYAQALAAPR